MNLIKHMTSSARAMLAAGAILALPGCISVGAGGEPPESLLTLTSTASAPAGLVAVTGAEGTAGAIAVLTPETPAKLDVLRIPVNVTDTEVAYLQEAVWIEKPARLFRRMLGETLRVRGEEYGGVLILDNDDTPTLATQFVRGTLLDMTYDVRSSSVIVRYEAVRSDRDGTVTSRRFEARESDVLPEAEFVGPAMNRTANVVAAEVADWVLGQP